MTIFGLPEFQISAGVLIALVVVLILTGRLVPRRQLEDLREDRDARLAAAERQVQTWQAAYEAVLMSRQTAEHHVTQLMEVAHTTQEVLQALPLPPSPISEAPGYAAHEA